MHIHRFYKLILWSLLLSVFSSCQPVIWFLYDIHQPRDRSRDELKEYCQRKGVDTCGLLISKDSASFVRNYRQVIRTVPDMIVFNKKGDRLIYHDSVLCSSPSFDLSRSICRAAVPRTDSLQRLTDEWSYYTPLDSGVVMRSMADSSADYTVFIVTARFLGRLNKKEVRAWQRELKKQRDCRVKYYTVLLDPVPGIVSAGH